MFVSRNTCRSIQIGRKPNFCLAGMLNEVRKTNRLLGQYFFLESNDLKRIYAPRFLFEVDNIGLEIPEVCTQATPVVEPAPIARETNRTREFIALNSRVGLKADFLNAFVPAIGCYHPHLKRQGVWR